MPTVTFTSSGSWTALASTVDCQCWGEGGNGSAGATNSRGGGGGGGGEYAEETTLALTLSSNYTFTIGGGGTGTNTSFPGNSVTVTAHAGASSLLATGGSGGSGSPNSIHNNGGAGGGSSNGTGNKYGGGGGGSAGAGSAGGAGSQGAAGTAGSGSPPGAAGGNNGVPPGGLNASNGNAPGSGGGGGASSSSSHGSGGTGAAGQITIIYTTAVSGTATLPGVGTFTAGGSSFNSAIPGGQPVRAGTTWLRQFARWRHQVPWGPQIQHLAASATLSGVGTLAAYGALPNPTVVNQWSNSYGQGTTFTSITSALQSCVVPLNQSYNVGTGSGTPTEGNWLFTIASWTQDPSIITVHVGAGDDGHSWWREFPAAGAAGLTRTSVSYTPNIVSQVQNVYVAPDGEIAAINVLVVEIAGLGPWDTVSGTNVNYAGAATSLSLSLGAPAEASFYIAGVGGDNISSGQAFLPSGWQGLATQTQTNGSNSLADNILTAAFLPSTVGSVSVSGTSSTAEGMSGFLLAVQVSGADPVPATQNPNWPHMVFEAGFGSGFNTPDSEITWTDLTPRMWDWEETTGIQYELGQLQSTNLTLHLDNFDGFLSPDNTSSPYYPNLVPGTPLRLRAALGTIGGSTVNRWYVIQRNAAQWNEKIDDVFRRYCEVSGTDLWAALSSVPPSFYRSEVYEDDPYAWWPCDDQPGTSGVLPTYLLNAAQGNTNVLNILLSPNGGALQQFNGVNGQSGAGIAPPGLATYTVGVDQGWMFGDPLGVPASIDTGSPVSATPGSAAWQATGQAGSTGSYGWYLSCNDTGFPSLSGGVTVEVWFNAAFYGSAQGLVTNSQENESSEYFWFTYTPVTQQPYNNQITILELATASAPVAVLQLDASGHLDLITYNGGTGTTHAIYTASDLRSDSWHMVTMTLTTAGWAVWLDGGANAQVSGSATITSGWTWLIGNADMGSGGGVNTSQIENSGNISLSHIAVYPYVLPYYRILDHYWAAVTAFGQLPAPSGVQVQWIVGRELQGGTQPSQYVQQPATTAFAPDGTPPGSEGSFYSGSAGVSASAIVVATAPGGVVSGISAQATGADGGQFISVDEETIYDSWWLWVGWSGLAPSFNVYTGNTTGADNEAAVVNGAGTSFASGYGATASATGVSATAGGSGAAPPASASSIGDTVGQRIERLARSGRFTSPNRCIDPASLLTQAPGSQSSGVQVGASIQQVTQSDSGLLFVDNLNHLTYWQRPHLAAQYDSPVWEIGPTTTAGRIPYYKEIKWVTDPQHVYNAITVDPVSPTGASLPLITPNDASAVQASQVQYGAQPLQIASWLQSVSEMQNQANFLFSVYGTPRRHVEQLKIEASAYPQAWELVMGINMGDIVTCEDWQIGGGGGVYTFRVTQVERHVEMGSGDDPATTGSVTLILDYEPTSYWS